MDDGMYVFSTLLVMKLYPTLVYKYLYIRLMYSVKKVEGIIIIDLGPFS